MTRCLIALLSRVPRYPIPLASSSRRCLNPPLKHHTLLHLTHRMCMHAHTRPSCRSAAESASARDSAQTSVQENGPEPRGNISPHCLYLTWVAQYLRRAHPEMVGGGLALVNAGAPLSKIGGCASRMKMGGPTSPPGSGARCNAPRQDVLVVM